MLVGGWERGDFEGMDIMIIITNVALKAW